MVSLHVVYSNQLLVTALWMTESISLPFSHEQQSSNHILGGRDAFQLYRHVS